LANVGERRERSEQVKSFVGKHFKPEIALNSPSTQSAANHANSQTHIFFTSVA
jgi:hypothetical protein